MNSKYINYMNIEIHSGDKNRVTPSVEIVRDILEKENMKPIKGIYSKPLQLIMDLGKDYAISNRKDINNFNNTNNFVLSIINRVANN